MSRLPALLLIMLALMAPLPVHAQEAQTVFVYNAWLLSEDSRNGTVYATMTNEGETTVTLTTVTTPFGSVSLSPMRADAPTIGPGETLALTPDTAALYVMTESDAPLLQDGVLLMLTFETEDGTLTNVTTAALRADNAPDDAAIVVLAGRAEPTARNAASAPNAGGFIAAVSLTLENRSNADDALVSATSPRAREVEIHQTQAGTTLRLMQRLNALSLAAGERLTLSPDGAHLMLIELDGHLLPGEVVPLTLSFESGLTLTVAIPVPDERSTPEPASDYFF